MVSAHLTRIQPRDRKVRCKRTFFGVSWGASTGGLLYLVVSANARRRFRSRASSAIVQRLLFGHTIHEPDFSTASSTSGEHHIRRSCHTTTTATAVHDPQRIHTTGLAFCCWGALTPTPLSMTGPRSLATARGCRQFHGTRSPATTPCLV
jgi:hypothetical protein